MKQANLNYLCNFWTVKSGIYFRYGKSNFYVGKLFGNKKQYHSQQMKTAIYIKVY
jgi:hypothetical protein